MYVYNGIKLICVALYRKSNALNRLKGDLKTKYMPYTVYGVTQPMCLHLSACNYGYLECMLAYRDIH